MSDKTGFGIDWNKAPIDATHYDVDSHLFVNFDCMHDSLRSLVPRPATPSAWDGTGLPPVGTVCELRTKVGGWGEAVIKYQAKRGICVWLWVRLDGNSEQIEWAESPDKLEFRPIKTAEQLAAEDRERVTDEMYGHTKTKMTAAEVDIQRETCADLYDAGYRKQGPAK